MWKSVNVKTSFPGKKDPTLQWQAHDSESIKEPSVEMQGGTQGFCDTTPQTAPQPFPPIFSEQHFLKTKQISKQTEKSLKRSG